MGQPPLFCGGIHCSVIEVVVVDSRAGGLSSLGGVHAWNAAIADGSPNPLKFAAWTMNLYYLPGIKLVAR